MRKTLISLGLAAGFSLAAFAQQPVHESFLNGSALVMTNNTAYTFQQQNVPFLDFLVSGGGPYNGLVGPFGLRASLSTSNMLPTIVSNSTTGFLPGNQYFTNYAGTFSSTNVNAGGWNVNTNVTQPAAWQDVPLFSDRNSDAPYAAIWVSIPGQASNSTNTMSFVFSTVNHSFPTITGASTNADTINTFTFTLKANGTSQASIKTNFPTGFLTGALGLRLVSVTSDNNTTAGATNIPISDISLIGWR